MNPLCPKLPKLFNQSDLARFFRLFFDFLKLVYYAILADLAGMQSTTVSVGEGC
jgi:hypothetical protein